MNISATFQHQTLIASKEMIFFFFFFFFRKYSLSIVTETNQIQSFWTKFICLIKDYPRNIPVKKTFAKISAVR